MVGTYQITITLDSADDIEEFEEGDNVFSGEVRVRAHTPELTINEFRNITVDPLDYWLDDIYSNHEVNLTTYILNEDYVTSASSVSCLLYTSPSPRDATLSRMPSSA